MARQFLPTVTKALKLKAAEKMPPAMARRYYTSGMGNVTAGTPYLSNWSTERGITQGMMRSVWAFKAIDSIAKSACMLPIEIRRGDYNSEDVVDHLTGPKLWYRMNVKSSNFDYAIAFRYKLICQLLLSDAGVFVEYARDRNGEVTQMHLLNPDTTSPIPDERTFVSGFQVTSVGRTEVVPVENVLWIRIPHPTDPYKSFTPLSAAGLSIDLDFYSRLYNRNFMANDGRPGGVLSVKGSLGEDDAEVLHQRFNTKSEPGRISVIESEGIDYMDFSMTPRDAAYGDLRKSVSEEILIAFGVPRSVAGDASGRTYDNADAEENMFWRQTMMPYLRFLDMYFGSLTPGGDDDDLWVAHNVMSVQSLQRPIRENENRLMEQFREGAITIDELRDGLGRELFNRPGSNTLYLAGGKIGVGRDEAEAETIKELTVIGAPPPPDAPTPPPSGPAQTRVGAMFKTPGTPIIENRLQGLLTARSPERMQARAAIEARATAVRREEDRNVASTTRTVKQFGEALETKDDNGRNDFNMVALKVPASHARHIYKSSPVLPGDVDKAHVTMVLFKGDVDKAAGVLADWAQRTAPLDVFIGPQVTIFPDGDDGRPMVVDAKSEALMEARQDLRDSLETAGMQIKEYPEYHPHMTLAYLPSGTKHEPHMTTEAAVRHTFGEVYVELDNGDSANIDLIGA